MFFIGILAVAFSMIYGFFLLPWWLMLLVGGFFVMLSSDP